MKKCPPDIKTVTGIFRTCLHRRGMNDFAGNVKAGSDFSQSMLSAVGINVKMYGRQVR